MCYAEKAEMPFLLRELIIWDLIGMESKSSLETVNLLMQDLTCTNNSFGDETVALGVDFRHASPIDACVKKQLSLEDVSHSHSFVQHESRRVGIVLVQLPYECRK